jgi:hypothetical protein
MVKGKSLEVVDVAVGRVRSRKWKGVVIEGHPTTAERAGRNKKGRTKGRRGDGLRQGEHEAKGTRRRYVTLRLRWSEQSERSETSAKIRFRAQRPSYRYSVLVPSLLPGARKSDYGPVKQRPARAIVDPQTREKHAQETILARTS